jgi:16S rRNA (guanine966-N2)-methyltransferase
MRIISGKLKGRYLVEFKADHIRPTTDRVKESIFNILRSDIEGASVLDLFAGTGNLTIEAWSRDAAKVVAVELNKKSLEIINKNIQTFKIQDGIEILRQDVFRFLKAYKGSPFDVIFADPPFTEKIGHAVMEQISSSAVVGQKTIVVIETAKVERIDDKYENLVLIDRREFGDKRASFYSPATVGSDP